LVVAELPVVHPPLTPPSREGNKRKAKRDGEVGVFLIVWGAME